MKPATAGITNFDRVIYTRDDTVTSDVISCRDRRDGRTPLYGIKREPGFLIYAEDNPRCDPKPDRCGAILPHLFKPNHAPVACAAHLKLEFAALDLSNRAKTTETVFLQPNKSRGESSSGPGGDVMNETPNIACAFWTRRRQDDAGSDRALKTITMQLMVHRIRYLLCPSVARWCDGGITAQDAASFLRRHCAT
jgi:hypothetical protein